jgi:hypothetical protein
VACLVGSKVKTALNVALGAIHAFGRYYLNVCCRG